MSDEVYRVPVVFVMSLVSKPFILDLTFGQSFVQYMLAQGFDVFMVDWGIPRPEDKRLKLDDYVLDFTPRCFEEVQKATGEKDYSILGYCMGGQLALMHAALNPGAPIANMVCAATPVDMEGMGLFRHFSDRRWFDVDRLVDAVGNIPPDFMLRSFEMLRPMDRWMSYVRLLDNLWDPVFVYGYRVMYKWTSEQIPFAGEAYRQMIRALMWENKLMKNTLTLDNRRVHRKAITCPVPNGRVADGLVRKTGEEFGGVDILVNNAGTVLFAPIAGGNPENMRRLFDVNFWGAINCIQAAVPYMQAQRSGHIVNVASVAAKVSPPYMGIYSATKFALSAVSDALRSELAGSGIGVSTIYPGLTSTSFMENMTQELEVPSLPPVARFVDPSVVGHRISQAIRFGFRDAYISPEDIAAVALNTVAPQIVDWTMRALMGRPPALDSAEIELPPLGLRRREADAEPSGPA